MVRPSRAHRRGVSRSSRTWSAGCDGRMGDAREFFVRTNGADADAKACGPGLPTLRPSRAVTSRAMTGARKPGSRGERAISVKTVAQGMPDDPAEPVVPSPCFFHCTGAMGEAVARHSLRPLISEGQADEAQLGRFLPRERGPVPIPRSSKSKNCRGTCRKVKPRPAPTREAGLDFGHLAHRHLRHRFQGISSCPRSPPPCSPP